VSSAPARKRMARTRTARSRSCKQNLSIKDDIRNRRCFYIFSELTYRERPERGGHCLTVEIETNGDSWSTYERGHALVGSLGSLCRNKRFFSCLGCSSRPSTKIFFLPAHFYTLFLPNAQQAVQAVVPGRMSFNMCLWSYLRQVGRKEVDMNDVRMTSDEYAGRQHNMFPKKDSS
jgi:hypothetical protein